MFDILVIDNSTSDRVIIKMMLERHSQTGVILECSSGSEAMNLLAERENPAMVPLIVLCDLNLDSELGSDVIQMIRKTHGKKHYFYVLMSGERYHLRELGEKPYVDAILEKMFDIEDWDREIARMYNNV